MQTKTCLFTLLVCIITCLPGCHKIDENVRGGIMPPQKLEMAFDSLYPHVTDALWRVKNNYYIITFTYNMLKNTVWLTAQGDFAMQQTELPFDYLPRAVTAAFDTSRYMGLPFQHADSLVRPDRMTLYLIEIKIDDKTDLNLYYTSSGYFVEEVPTKEDIIEPEIVPEAVFSLLRNEYDNALLVNITYINNRIELLVYQNNAYRTITLTDDYQPVT